MRHAPFALALLAGAALLAPAAGVARADQVRTIESVYDESVDIMDGAAQNGGRITTESGRQIALADAQHIALNPLETYFAAPGHARIALRGGDVINAEIVGGDDLGVKVRGRSLGEVKIDLELIEGILFSPASFDADKVRLFEQSRLRADKDQDVVYLQTGGETEGTIELIDTDGVKMESKTVGEVNFELGKLESLVLVELNPLEPPPPGPRVRTRLRDGSLVTGKLVSYQKGDKLVIDCRLGEKFEIPAREVSTMTVVGGRTVYLSDLTPSKVQEAFGEFGGAALFPFDPRYSWKADRTCGGEPIRLGGKLHERGIGVHSRTELTYELDGELLELRAAVALDDSAREPSGIKPTVTFQVIVDGKPRYADGLLVGPDDDPRQVRVDVKGAKQLVLLVDFGESLHERGRALWIDAHLIRK